MKLVQLQEARYSAPPTETLYFVVEHTGDNEHSSLVGPFSSSDDAMAFSKYMFGEYGDDVALTHEIFATKSPEQYEKEIKDHRDWLHED